MQWINVTREALAMIYRHADPLKTFNPKARPSLNGTFDIPLEEETVRAVKSRMLPGETISDCIIRVFSSTN